MAAAAVEVMAEVAQVEAVTLAAEAVGAVETTVAGEAAAEVTMAAGEAVKVAKVEAVDGTSSADMECGL